MTRSQHQKLLHALAENKSVDVPGYSLVSPSKARDILSHGEVHGEPLTAKQKGFFGLRAGGGRPTRLK